MDPIIEMHGLTKSFRGKPAVSQVTLTVPKGSIFGLLGDNGAGKTTIIRMLTGLLRPDGGRATILGLDCWTAAGKLRHRVGYVPERPKYYDWMTAGEIGWFTAGFYPRGFIPRFQELAGKLKLDLKAKLSTLSKGQYAKVGLALALAQDPDVLVLDEPTSGLDLFVRREFLSSMVGLAEEGRTILISSHQVAEIERVASHVAFVAEGRLLLTATMEELRQRIVRLQLRHDGQPPEARTLGTVLQRNGTGKHWQAIIQDPNRPAVEALRTAEGIFDVEETPVGLEEVYCALLARTEGEG
jgi:ABC-2 type transport system ATP-binding protein